MRDPERIPMILAAVERHWRQDPDARLGQTMVNLMRLNRSVLTEDEGRVLFDVEDGELLSWIGPETDEERRYIELEPGRRQEAWRGQHRAHEEGKD